MRVIILFNICYCLMSTLVLKRDLICSNVMLNSQSIVTCRSKLLPGTLRCSWAKTTKLKKQLKGKKNIPPHLVLGRTYKIVEGLPVRPRDLPSNCDFPDSNSTQRIWFPSAAVKQVVWPFHSFLFRKAVNSSKKTEGICRLKNTTWMIPSTFGRLSLQL